MLSTLFDYISAQGISGIQRLSAGILSLLVTAGSTLGSYAGDTQKMIAEGFDRDAIEISVEFELDVKADELTGQIDELNEAYEKEVEYSNARKGPGYSIGIGGSTAAMLLFNEQLEFTPMKLQFPKEDIPGIYENGALSLDGSLTFTYSKDASCGSMTFDIDGIMGDHALYFDSEKITFSPDLAAIAVEFLSDDIKSVYTEHFKSLSYSCSTNAFLAMLTDKDGKLSEILDGFSFYSHSLPEVLSSLSVREIVTMLEDKEFTAKLAAFIGEYTKPINQNFVKRTVDGCEARIFELTGNDYLDYIIGHYDYVKDDRVIGAYKELTDYVHSTESLSFLAESELFEFTDKKEIKNSFATYAHRRSDIAKFTKTAQSLRAIPDVSLLRFYYKYSKLKHTIFEKDGDTHQRLEFVVAKKEDDALVTLRVNSVISDAKSEIPTADKAIAKDKLTDGELFANKLAQKEAIRKGVTSLDIDWSSKMTPDMQVPLVSKVSFEVNYQTAEKATKDSSAHLVDGSVYLPLRQLMENAGYEVSWDAENYKAYVTVDGKKIEMTGKLIDSKTYVKVRDFEKLGAKVDYTEELHYANAHNDFFKECVATITFK